MGARPTFWFVSAFFLKFLDVHSFQLSLIVWTRKMSTWDIAFQKAQWFYPMFGTHVSVVVLDSDDSTYTFL